jgi:hypothetical protein
MREIYEDLGFDNHGIGTDDALALQYSRPL